MDPFNPNFRQKNPNSINRNIRPPQNPNIRSPQIPNFRPQNPNICPQNQNFLNVHNPFLFDPQAMQYAMAYAQQMQHGVRQELFHTGDMNPTMNLGGGSSYSQYTNEYEVEPEVEPEVEEKLGGHRLKNWSIAADKVLCSAWCQTTTDPVVGNEQKCDRYWQRVTDFYNEYHPIQVRTLNSCRSHMRRILEQSQKFTGCYDQAGYKCGSGSNEDDQQKTALELFKSNTGSRFTLMHCWLELRQTPKFSQFITSQHARNATQKRSKVNDSGDYSSPSNPSTPGSGSATQVEVGSSGDELPRPIGRKQAKRKGKKKVQTNEHISTMLQLEKDKIIQLEQLRLGDEAKTKAYELIAEAKLKKEQRKLREEERMQKEADQKILFANTSNYTPIQLAYHRMQMDSIVDRLGLDPNIYN